MGVATSALGCWLLDWIEEWGKRVELLAVSLMNSGAVIFGIGVFKALDRRPVLIVDGDGVLDRTSFPGRRIPWADIRGFQLTPRERKPTYLASELADPEAFIASSLLNFARPMLEAFKNTCGSPCVARWMPSRTPRCFDCATHWAGAIAEPGQRNARIGTRATLTNCHKLRGAPIAWIPFDGRPWLPRHAQRSL